MTAVRELGRKQYTSIQELLKRRIPHPKINYISPQTAIFPLRHSVPSEKALGHFLQ
jgi:hypothetical protein